MTIKSSLKKLSAPYLLAITGGALSSILGALVLVGWYTHDEALIQVSADFVPMQYNTALGFLLSGLGLLVVTRGSYNVGMVCGIFVMLTGLLTLAEYIFGIDLSIDQLLMQHYITVQTSHPGRMAPNTALCFSLTGAALVVLATTAKVWKPYMIVSVLGSLVFGLGVISLMGYVLNMEAAYGWGELTHMAVHTAGGFVFLGIAVVSLVWYRDVSDTSRLPSWLPVPVGVGIAGIVISLWQAIESHEATLLKEYGVSVHNSLADGALLVVGIVLAIALSLAVYLAQIAINRESEVKAVNRKLAAEIDERKMAEKALRKSEKRIRQVVETVPDILYTASLPDFIATYISPAIERLLGFTSEQWLADPEIWVKQIHNEDRSQLLTAMEDAYEKKESFAFEYRLWHKDDKTLRWFEDRGSWEFDSEGNAVALQGIMTDITERNKYIAELEHKALYDSLTELPNRFLLQDRLQHSLKAAKRDSWPLAVILIDVVRLSDVNDIIGHGGGDLVLQEVANRLWKTLRESDTVARLTGDEFVLVLPRVLCEHIDVTVAKIRSLFEQSITIEDTALEIEAALGIALYPEHGDTPDILLQHANIALRTAKKESLEFSIYDPEQDPFSLRQLKLFGELRQALAKKELTLYYQPQIDLSSNRVKSVEALARWSHPVEGMIPPNDFIPMIEQSGLIKPFTLWVLDEAIEQLNRWSQQGIDLSIAVNLSARNLLDPQLPYAIEKMLESHSVDPAHLTLEVTESAIMTRPESALKILTKLHDMGLKLSIDDFGTGYSSLAYLKKFPVDELKIDQSFVFDLAKNNEDTIIVRSTIDLAQNMGLKVVAEGVEDEHVLAKLSTLSCNLAQGYYMSRPVPIQELENWLLDSPWGLKND